MNAQDKPAHVSSLTRDFTARQQSMVFKQLFSH